MLKEERLRMQGGKIFLCSELSQPTCLAYSERRLTMFGARVLITSDDHSMPPDLQRMLWNTTQGTEGADIAVEEIASGHSPMLSKPEETVDFIVRTMTAFKKE